MITTDKNSKRLFIPKDFKVKDWEQIQPFFEDLLNREINSSASLKNWLKNRSELETILSEDCGWRYIKMSCDTENESLRKSYEEFVTKIDPNIAPFTNELNKKLLSNSFVNDLQGEAYLIYVRQLKKQTEIYREENIPLQTLLSTKCQQYGAIAGAMSVEVGGKECTLQQAAKFLKDENRDFRKDVYFKIITRRLKDKKSLDLLFNELIELRDQVSKNANYLNYRDYMFDAMGRFDYTAKDCTNFHESIAIELVPIMRTFDLDRKNALKLDELKPWDNDVDISGEKPLAPFENAEELVQKTINCFNAIKPQYGDYIKKMNEMGHLDLTSRKGKAPGGYNYPLYETGVPFIFMNAVGTLQDVVTMVHEGGHAIHSFKTNELELVDFKSVPSEVAELASMGMELISMEHWNAFFDNKEELKRAKKDQLEKVLDTLPWVATIDKFQHWLYLNPKHTVEERTATWNLLMDEFSSDVVSWKNVEDARSNLWQKQLHLFEVPFYYIEYGMAQLGAIALWRNYKKNSEATLIAYEKCLSLGYTCSIPKLYEAAGIKFDFSPAYVKQLVDFVKEELSALG